MILSSEELTYVYGGATTSVSSLLNAITKVVTTVLDIGRAVGSSLRRAITKNYCS